MKEPENHFKDFSPAKIIAEVYHHTSAPTHAIISTIQLLKKNSINSWEKDKRIEGLSKNINDIKFIHDQMRIWLEEYKS